MINTIAKNATTPLMPSIAGVCKLLKKPIGSEMMPAIRLSNPTVPVNTNAISGLFSPPLSILPKFRMLPTITSPTPIMINNSEVTQGEMLIPKNEFKNMARNPKILPIDIKVSNFFAILPT